MKVELSTNELGVICKALARYALTIQPDDSDVDAIASINSKMVQILAVLTVERRQRGAS